MRSCSSLPSWGQSSLVSFISASGISTDLQHSSPNLSNSFSIYCSWLVSMEFSFFTIFIPRNQQRSLQSFFLKSLDNSLLNHDEKFPEIHSLLYHLPTNELRLEVVFQFLYEQTIIMNRRFKTFIYQKVPKCKMPIVSWLLNTVKTILQ